MSGSGLLGELDTGVGSEHTTEGVAPEKVGSSDNVGGLYRLLAGREKVWDTIGEQRFLEERAAEGAIDGEDGVERVIRARQEKEKAREIALQIFSMKKRLLNLKIEGDRGELEALMREARKKLNEEWITSGHMEKKVGTTLFGGVLRSWFGRKE